MDKEILAIIPAREGSKGIKNKNIKLFNNKPLIYWSIKLAKECKYINRIICSTDSKKYAKIASQCGAETPFLRPSEISQDLSTDYELIEHCLNELKKENYIPDIIVQLRPTYPNRKLEILNETISLFLKNYNEYDSLRTIIPFNKSPFKMYRIKKNINNNKLNLKPLFKKIDNIDEPYNRCRQELPKTYLHNGYIDIIKTDTVLKLKSVTGNNIYPYLMKEKEKDDIDTLKDWLTAENK